MLSFMFVPFVLLIGLASSEFMCGYTRSRKTFSCSTGVFVRDVRNTFDQVELHEPEMVSDFVNNLVAKYNYVNIVTLSKIETELMKGLFGQSKYPVKIDATHTGITHYVDGPYVNITSKGKKFTLKGKPFSIKNTQKMLVISDGKTTADKGYPNSLWIILKRVGYHKSIFHATIKLATTTITDSKYCIDHNLGVGLTNRESMLGTDGLVFYGENGELHSAEIDYLVTCKRDLDLQTGEVRPSDKLIINETYGSPTTWINTASGFSTQKWPLKHFPIKISRGFCPRTKVNITKECPVSEHSYKSRDQQGFVIQDWCCHNCGKNGIHMVDSNNDCWMPHEAIPMTERNLIDQRMNEVMQLENEVGLVTIKRRLKRTFL